MDRVDAYRVDKRHYDRNDENDGGGGVEEHPHDQEEDVEKRQDEIAVVGQLDDALRDLLRHSDRSQVVTEQGRGGDEQHDDGGLASALEDGGTQVSSVEAAIDQAADEGRGDDGEPGAFSGRDPTAEDAAKDDGRQQ